MGYLGCKFQLEEEFIANERDPPGLAKMILNRELLAKYLVLLTGRQGRTRRRWRAGGVADASWCFSPEGR